ncbi:helix-turn-helix domain-containing protein [Pseudomonas sp. Gutcm_11s]|uniref:helix-turn-helix domain-containing protein n=1 Tax=Pseudomonas sp. Gutcm_11s TaxID=3026088 RepID=UPI00235E38A5|nr:helix-turn-helix transcriptional regulator [Pseudomonas sp. Gutcm_11s]MDD0841410.1 helix-turn-helix transcriptional regulator [Pseudomonas sp. Gutcm_11s]
MELKDAFGLTLRQFRKAKELTQEDFSQMSSRTYLSVLERGLKSPTLDKIDELSKMIGIHPVTLVAGSYLKLEEPLTIDQLLSLIRDELQSAEFDSTDTKSE